MESLRNNLEKSYSLQNGVFSESHELRDNFSHILTSKNPTKYLHVFLEFTEYFQMCSLIFDSQYHRKVL